MRRAILILVASALATSASAETPTFADWVTGVAEDHSYIYAATTNDSGETFGEYCYYESGKCLWLIGMHTKCKKSQRGVLLANSDSAAVPLDINCLGNIAGALSAYSFQDWKSLESSLKDSIRVGFAVPLESDKFQVVRFSLNGRTDATATVESSFATKIQARNGQRSSSENTSTEIL